MSNILTNNINPRSGNTINIGGVNTKVSIAGTLTYEDVTSVDSVGVITAQSGVVVSGGGINVTGVSTFNDNIRVSAGQSVGIGTTALCAIHVKGTKTENIRDREIRIDATANGLAGEHAGMFRVVTGDTAFGKYLIGYGDEHPSQTNEFSLKNIDGPLTFYSNNTGAPAMVIGQRSNAGAGSSVGIGTTRPAADLDIAGNIEMNGSELAGFLTGDIPSDAIRTYHLVNDIGLKKVKGGLMMITAHANTSSGEYGLYPQPIGTGILYYDAGNSLTVPIVLAEAATGLLGSSSSSTTITDFTDNRVTIVVLQDNIRIVNRINSARNFKLTFL